MKVDRSGHGLLKVWKQQLLQFKSVSPDVAQALIVEYPSPQLLRQVTAEFQNTIHVLEFEPPDII